MATDFALVSRARLDNLIGSAGQAPHLQAVLSAVRDHRLAWLTLLENSGCINAALDTAPEAALVLLGDDTDRALGPAGFHAASTRRLFHKAAYVAVMSGAPVAEVYAAACRHAVEERCLVVLVETRVEQKIAWVNLVRETNPLAALLITSPQAGRA